MGKTARKIIFGSLAVGLAALPVALSLMPGTAFGTDPFMRSLPAYNKFQCTLCHTAQVPTPSTAALTVFGVDFKGNGSVWNATLAAMNSDGDGCINGFEVGDENGDGIFDAAGTPIENSNPSNPNDCTLPINRKTWGIIKDMFSKETLEFSQNVESTADLALHLFANGDIAAEFALHFP